MAYLYGIQRIKLMRTKFNQNYDWSTMYNAYPLLKRVKVAKLDDL